MILRDKFGGSDMETLENIEYVNGHINHSGLENHLKIPIMHAAKGLNACAIASFVSDFGEHE